VSVLRRLFGLIVWLFFRDRPPRPQPDEPEERPPIVPMGTPAPRAEIAVVILLGLAALCAVAFIVVYAVHGIADQTQYLGLAIGGAFAFIAAALIVSGRHLIVTEHLETEYGEPDPESAADIDQLVRESGGRLRRRRLLALGAAAATTALAAALVTPIASLGPVLNLARFTLTPWRRGRRLVDDDGRPIVAAAIQPLELVTAYPEHADREQLGAPIVLVRLDPSALHLPPGRASWAPDGIVAYSKICTHAGCAIALYRAPLFQPVDGPPGLVCPCHYSTFDPATGGTVVFGPAGRPLPQLPLTVDRRGHLRAGGTFSGPVGPSWWSVRDRGATPT
jgi:ubiquinol-cytochrome c reductase iron-sulfur subunit